MSRKAQQERRWSRFWWSFDFLLAIKSANMVISRWILIRLNVTCHKRETLFFLYLSEVELKEIFNIKFQEIIEILLKRKQMHSSSQQSVILRLNKVFYKTLKNADIVIFCGSSLNLMLHCFTCYIAYTPVTLFSYKMLKHSETF